MFNRLFVIFREPSRYVLYKKKVGFGFSNEPIGTLLSIMTIQKRPRYSCNVKARYVVHALLTLVQTVSRHSI